MCKVLLFEATVTVVRNNVGEDEIGRGCCPRSRDFSLASVSIGRHLNSVTSPFLRASLCTVRMDLILHYHECNDAVARQETHDLLMSPFWSGNDAIENVPDKQSG